MLVDITNIGKYRVSWHGKSSWVLFNREDDLVYNISEDDYRYIKNLQTVARCVEVEAIYLNKAEPSFMSKLKGFVA